MAKPAPEPSAHSIALRYQHQASIKSIEQFKLQGRIGVQTEGKGFSGRVHWQHAVTGNSIALFSPLGSQVATIETTVSGVKLITSDGKTFDAEDTETLTQQTLGWSLPLHGLPDWVLGRPAPYSGSSEAIWDTSGKLTKFKQDDWEVEYFEYVDVNDKHLPAKLSLRSTKLYLKLIIEQWEILPVKQDGQL